jgi:hypothetical protein
MRRNRRARDAAPAQGDFGTPVHALAACEDDVMPTGPRRLWHFLAKGV